MRIDTGRLVRSIQSARLSLQKPREVRREIARQVAGQHWSEEGSVKKQPANMLALYIQVIGRNLVAKDPRMMLSTYVMQMKPVVKALESWANREIMRMRLGEVLQEAVIDSLYCMGIVKVALATPMDASAAAWDMDAGKPFAEVVDMDDFVVDMHARDFRHVSFIGHRFRAPRDAAIAMIGRRARVLEVSQHRRFNEQGDERIGMLGRTYHGDDQEFEDMVDLWEVYLPRHRKVMTFADSEMSGPKGDVLLEQKWVGPDSGPLHILGMGKVAGNLIPKGPLQDLVDLNDGMNNSVRKLLRTVERIKEVTVVRRQAAEDGERVMKASDGDVLGVDDPESLQQVSFSGTTLQSLVAASTMFKQLFSYVAGNLDLLGGQGPQSKTATQDQILAQNATAGLAEMQSRSMRFVTDVMEALVWYWWNDPVGIQQVPHSIGGVVEMTRTIFPAGMPVGLSRDGRIEDLDIRVDPYSMLHHTPQTRLDSMRSLLQTVVLPMAPILAQQGIVLDMNRYLRMESEYQDLPELPEILTIQEPPQSPQVGRSSSALSMGSGPPREYVRHNVSEKTPQGQDKSMIQNALGKETGGSADDGGF